LTKINVKDLAPIVLVMLLMFVSIACANMLIPSYPAIQKEFKLIESLLAIPDAFFVLTSAFFALIWGYYTDRIDRTKVIKLGAFFWTTGMILTSISTNYLMLVISRMVSGAGLGCVIPVGYSIISDAIPPDERSGWFGMLAILSSISNGVGQALSSFIGPLLSWRFPFLILAFISVFVIILLFFIKIPKRGAKEDELMDLSEMNLEYHYIIAKKDLKKIIKKKTNKFLIIQEFFFIIPGTLTIYFLTSTLNIYFLYQIPSKIRLQTATIMAGILGIGYLLGNMTISYLGDVLFRKNKKNRTRLALICSVLTIPFFILTMVSITPVDITKLAITYPDPIPTNEITKYMVQTIIEIFKNYPSYILYFIFGLIATILSAGPVANRTAILIDVNLPEHRGTSISFINLSSQLGKAATLFGSYFLITWLGDLYKVILFSVIFWVPTSILWFFTSRTVSDDLAEKTMILSERKQLELIDYIFELEIQMDRAIQKVQDSKYYIFTNRKKFNMLLDDAIKIFNHCEKMGKFRSITNIEKKAIVLNTKTQSIKHMANQIFKLLEDEDLSEEETMLLNHDLEQIAQMISEGEKSTFGDLQIYYDDAYLKIIEARLLRKTDLIKSMNKILEAVSIYQRLKNMLNERLEVFNDESTEISGDDLIALEKERELYQKCSETLKATLELKNNFENIFVQLEDKGIKKQDLLKLSELTLEYGIDLVDILLETFGQDTAMKKGIISILNHIDKIFDDYDKFKEIEKKVF